MSGVHAAALFTSWLQPSEALTAGRVAEAIDWAVRQFGVGGCVGRMAQESGDHPEAAAERMRWVRRVAAEVPVAAATVQAVARSREACVAPDRVSVEVAEVVPT